MAKPPTMSSACRGSVRATGAFTLVEMLAVMIIMGLLLGLIVPALRSLSESGGLTRAGQVVNDQMGLARQVAAAKNITIEVRLFKTADSSVGFTAIQLWVSRLAPPAAATMVPLDKVYRLPTGIAISENTKLSQIITVCPAAIPMTEAGQMNGNSYIAFQIKPLGTVTPVSYNVSATSQKSGSIMSGVYLTVLPARSAGPTLPSPLPKNYVTVQLNPYTGSPLVYRP